MIEPDRKRAEPVLAYDTIASAIQARHLQTELLDAIWVGARENPAAASARLSDLDYDQAPVGRPGRLLGYVLTNELADADSARAGRLIHRLNASIMVSGSAGVLDVMDVLRQKPLAFVVDGRHVTGFVTASDLNKHPARAHFYLLLADLEMSLAEAVRGRYSNETMPLGVLNATERRKVMKRLERDRRENLAVDVVAGMDLAHLLAVAGQDRGLRSAFRSRSPRAWEEWAEELVHLRNAVMHPVLSFIGKKRTVADLARVEREIRRIIDRRAPTTA